MEPVIIGDCQLYQGDCLEVMPRLPKVDMVLTDPPYGTTACKWDSIIPLDDMWGCLKQVANDNAAVVMTASQPFTSALVSSNYDWFKYCWVWEKGKATGHLNAKKMPMKKHEDVLVFCDGAAKYNPQGLVDGVFNSSRPAKGVSKGEVYGQQRPEYEASSKGNYPKSIIKFSGEHKPVHPTQKPVALMEYLIRTYTNEGDTVLDFTMGSGTTGVACVNTGRKFIGIEMDANYFEIARNRIQECLDEPKNCGLFAS